jgi:curli biogenesis system outer membrane secretion channel CsgG
MRRMGCILLAAAAAFGQSKRSVSIEDFDYSTVRTVSQAVFGTQVDVGKGISALLVKRVAQDGKFTVVERNKVSSVLKEQDFGASGRVKKGSQARIGQIRGADFTIMGDIVAFGRDDRSRGGAAGAAVPGAGGVGGVRHTEGKAVVILNFRMVDNESSEIVMTGEARGESKRSSTKGFAGVWAGGVLVGGGVDFSSANFAETIIGEAVIDACDKLAIQIGQQSGSISSSKNVEIEGRVAEVAGAQIYINVGSSAGVQVGDKFEVSHIVREVRDPTTKEVLDVVTEPVGTLVVSSVREKIAIGTMSGGGAVKPGDKVEKK